MSSRPQPAGHMAPRSAKADKVTFQVDKYAHGFHKMLAMDTVDLALMKEVHTAVSEGALVLQMGGAPQVLVMCDLVLQVRAEAWWAA
eukprot:3820751-Amphidinium_carterae.1